MEFTFADRKLQRLYADRKFNAKMPPEVVRAFRDTMDVIRDAPD
jgi:plasmid maintenance system killer protein